MFDINSELLVLILVGSFCAGVINTFAGNGSTITLTLLMEIIGLPADIANATNRLGVLSNSAAPILVFSKNELKKPLQYRKIVLGTLVGAVCGVSASLIIDNDSFRSLYRYLLLGLFVVLLMKPSRWLSPKRYLDGRSPIWSWIILFVLGFYGGFIQMGMGIFLLATLVFVEGMGLLQANAVKLLVVGTYTTLAVVIFQIFGKINWEIGILFVVGQSLGGWLAAKWGVRQKNINKIIYWFLVVILILSLLHVFEIIDLSFGLQ